MRRLGIALVLCASVAHADDADDLIARGEQLAQEREYTAAIDAFKQADRKRPTSATACRIGLAYTRRELWPQAELFFSRCRERATPKDPLPDWIEAAEEQLATKLEAAHVAAITIVVVPGGVPAVITASAFASDETFSPRTIHLGAGVHTIEVTAPGFEPQSRELTVTEEPQTITIKLVPARAPDRVHPPDTHAQRSSIRAHHIALGGAIGLGVATLAVDLLSVRTSRNTLEAATTRADYDAHLGAYELRRNLDIGLAIGSVLATGLGLYLWSQDSDDGPRVSASFDTHAATFAIGWSR